MNTKFIGSGLRVGAWFSWSFGLADVIYMMIYEL